MNYISLIGTVGATLTTLCQVPQLIKIYKTKHTKDLSIETYIVLLAGVSLWIAYGILLHQPPIYISNIVTFILVFSILCLKIKYG